ncbi:MarR family transcriptional regulator [bacterium]|nr:MarR family transcriptional regulator [bacterium]
MSKSGARPTARAEASSIDVFLLNDSISHKLRRTLQVASEAFQKQPMADGVTLRQAEVLAAIAQQEGASQADLVIATGVDRSTMADMLKRMQDKGLINRATAARDGRAKSVALTAEGWEVLNEAQPRMREVNDALLQLIPKKKRDAFLAALDQLNGIDLLGAQAEPAAPSVKAKSGGASKKKRKDAGKRKKRKKSD